MKKIGLVFSLVLFFLVSFQVSAQWYQQLSGTLNSLNSLYFINDTTGWAVGGGGSILNTTDGGNNWLNLNSGITDGLNSVYFLDQNNGWIVGSYGIILRTTDGGYTWNETNIGVNIHLNEVCFVDSNKGWAVGGNKMYSTTDGGQNWQLQYTFVSSNPPTTIDLFSISFVDQSNGWVVGYYFNGWAYIGAIFGTTDGGITWQSQNAGTLDRYSVFFIDQNTGWAVGQNTTSGVQISKTTNGGNSWQTINANGSCPQLNSIFFVDHNYGWAVGYYGAMLNTTDGGNTWQFHVNETYTTFLSVYFADQNSGWVVGENGTILHTTNGGVTFIEEENNFIQPKEFLLQQNYPNPFNPSTKISWQTLASGWQTLKVYDILGNEVATLVDEYRNAGSYEVDFNPASSIRNPATGVYFYQLRVGNYIETKKMILLK